MKIDMYPESTVAPSLFSSGDLDGFGIHYVGSGWFIALDTLEINVGVSNPKRGGGQHWYTIGTRK